jgi:hypothetical protein
VSSTRETQAITNLAAYGYLTQRQIDEFVLGGSALSPQSRQVIVRRVLGRLKRLGLVLETPRVMSPGWQATRLIYFLTAAGYREAQRLNPELPARRPHRGDASLMAHALMCADVAVAFRQAARNRPGDELVDWESGWLAAERLGSTVVVPDARVVYATGEWEIDAFIEVDLATEGSRVFAAKVAQYLDLYRSGEWRGHLPVWPIVLTVTPSDARNATLRRVAATVISAQADAERIRTAFEFAFCPINDMTGPAGPLGAIWTFAGRSGKEMILGTLNRSSG